MNMIHPTALIADGARLADDVEIGPYVIIEEHVSIGSGTKIMAHAVVRGYTTIGERNQIHMGAIIGHDPQDVAFDPAAESYVRIGSNNLFVSTVPSIVVPNPAARPVSGIIIF